MVEYVRSCPGAELLAQSDGCSVFQFRNETGEGTFTMYEVFPGVVISFNDFHMRYYDSVFAPGGDLFSIDHCREGRMECPAAEEAYSYVEAGDLKLDRRLSHKGRFEMPLAHYHGATISFVLPLAEQSIAEAWKGFPVDIRALQEKFCPGIYPVVLHGDRSIEHIFAELYAVPQQIRTPYFQIKVLELLLFLEALELPEAAVQHAYFYRSQVERTKAVQTYLAEHPDTRETQEQLAARFDIPLTALKTCFKSIYGNTIAGWLLQYRMNQAAVMLRDGGDRRISEIAGAMGYESPSKFTAAFQRVMGMTPTEYRSRGYQKGADPV